MNRLPRRRRTQSLSARALAVGCALGCVLAAGLCLPLAAGEVVVQVLPGGGPVEIIVDGVALNPDGTPVTPPDPIAMAVEDVVRGKNAILKVLPKLDRAIVPALENAYLAAQNIDEDEALLLVAQLGDDQYVVREQATLTLVAVKAEIEAALRKQLELTKDPEVQWRLGRILQERLQYATREASLLPQALQIVYEAWFDELVKERAERLLNDPWDDPAALFFAQASGERLATALAGRPLREQAALRLGAARLLCADARSLRALGQIEAQVLIQVARETCWPNELPQPETAAETVLYRWIDGHSLRQALFVPHKEKRLYLVSQGFCIFQIPFGAGNPRPQTGALLRGRYEFRLDAGAMQPFTSRRLIFGTPPGMLLPKFPFVEGMDEDWNGNVARMPLWSKPFVPPEALKPSYKFVLNGGHELPAPAAADRNLTPAVAQARLHKHTADWLAQPAPAPAAGGDPTAAPDAAAWQAFHNANAAQLPAVLTRLAGSRQTAWIAPFSELAWTDRNLAGRAALDALYEIDPARAGHLALRLSRVRWRENRARYAVDFLKARFAQTALERAWDFERRFEPPAELLGRIPRPASR